MNASIDWDVINRRFGQVKEQAAGRSAILFDVLRDCSEMEAHYLKYLYAYMPLADLSDYDGILFLSFVKQAIASREAMPWGKTVPEELFLNYVLSYRLNNENITDFRGSFYDALFPRVKGLNLYDAALAVNRWCFEKATYRPTDRRTASPASMVKNVYGRCGECSVFTVGALRSVCIPARECYTPIWAHCDDNHAWVEVWVDGRWYYLGACEPDPVLGRGWFTHAATRAMLVASRNFTGYSTEPEITKKTDKIIDLNLLNSYADTRRLTVRVTEQGKPLENAEVRFELVNYGMLSPVAILMTDACGEASFLTGLGDLLIHVSKDGRFTHALADLRRTDCCEVDFSQAVTHELGDYRFDLIPPLEKRFQDESLPEETEAAYKEMVKESEKIRKAYEASFYNEETAAVLAESILTEAASKDTEFREKNPALKEKIAEMLMDALGNNAEIIGFLKAEDGLDLAVKVKFLKQLRKKDLTDTPVSLLYAHLRHALKYRDNFGSDEEGENLFFSAVANPRISYEIITEYREFIEAYFDAETTAAFRHNPVHIHEYIKTHIADAPPDEHRTLLSSPVGVLQLGIANRHSKDILFVAICRTLGIPARFSKTDWSLEYYTNDAWLTVDAGQVAASESLKSARIQLTAGEETLAYYRNFTLAVWEKGHYQTLHFDENETGKDMPVAPGFYRILTSSRRPDGGVLAHAYHVRVAENECMSLAVEVRKDDIGQYTKPVELEETLSESLMEASGDEGEGKRLLIWLEEGREPTAHLLSEILARAAVFKNLSASITFFTQDGRVNPGGTLAQLSKAIPKARVLQEDTPLKKWIAEKYELPVKDPFTVVMLNRRTVVFAGSGYDVGASDRLVRVVENVREEK